MASSGGATRNALEMMNETRWIVRTHSDKSCPIMFVDSALPVNDSKQFENVLILGYRERVSSACIRSRILLNDLITEILLGRKL